MKTKLFFTLLLALFLFSCKKNNLSFTEITSDKTTMNVGETAKITAHASGSDLKYEWSGGCATITGNGTSEISYYAYSGCCSGANVISCTVKSGSKKETKKITITVQ